MSLTVFLDARACGSRSLAQTENHTNRTLAQQAQRDFLPDMRARLSVSDSARAHMRVLGLCLMYAPDCCRPVYLCADEMHLCAVGVYYTYVYHSLSVCPAFLLQNRGPTYNCFGNGNLFARRALVFSCLRVLVSRPGLASSSAGLDDIFDKIVFELCT